MNQRTDRSERFKGKGRNGRFMISVVAAAFNEAPNLTLLYERVAAVLKDIADFELLVVDDGSTDESVSILRELRAGDERVCYVSLSRNFGHQPALLAGLDHSRGDVVISMDADLQHPPDVIPALLDKWRDGFEVVNTVRVNDPRYDSSVYGWLSGGFYRVFDWLSGLNLRTGRTDFRLMDRAVVDALCGLPETQKFVRGLAQWIGFRQTSIPYSAAPRARGEPKYTYGRMFTLALDAILSFSIVPLRMLTLGGVCLAIPAFLYMLVAIGAGLYAFYTGDFSRVAPGWASTVAAVMFFGGIQLLGMGLLGEYLGRVYQEAKGRPAYIVREVANRPGLKDSNCQ
jgi:glycosyltransferase involved in cell wall biosynthesis